MSDIGLLANEYQTASELARQINVVATRLKREHHDLPAPAGASGSELAVRRRDLGHLIGAVARLLDAEDGGDPVPAIPASFVQQARVAHGGALEYYRQDLRELAGLLADPSARLGERDLALLDELATFADAESSRVFRRLLRK